MLTRRTGAETSAVLLEDDEGAELVLEVDCSVRLGTNSPQRLSVAMRSKSDALSLPALRTSRCFVRLLLRCAILAACITLFEISANRLASAISSSISIFASADFFGRPPFFAEATHSADPVLAASSDSSEAVVSSAMAGLTAPPTRREDREALRSKNVHNRIPIEVEPIPT